MVTKLCIFHSLDQTSLWLLLGTSMNLMGQNETCLIHRVTFSVTAMTFSYSAMHSKYVRYQLVALPSGKRALYGTWWVDRISSPTFTCHYYIKNVWLNHNCALCSCIWSTVVVHRTSRNINAVERIKQPRPFLRHWPCAWTILHCVHW